MLDGRTIRSFGATVSSGAIPTSAINAVFRSGREVPDSVVTGTTVTLGGANKSSLRNVVNDWSALSRDIEI